MSYEVYVTNIEPLDIPVPLLTLSTVRSHLIQRLRSSLVAEKVHTVVCIHGNSDRETPHSRIDISSDSHPFHLPDI